MSLALEGGPDAAVTTGQTACIEGASNHTTPGGGETADVASAAGVADDFVECYRAHYTRVVRALELSGTARGVAEDVAQEAFARSFVHWWRVRRGTNPPGYVYRVAFRLARRGNRLPLEEPLPAEERQASRPWADEVAEEATLRTSATAAIAAMPAARRACAVLCLLAGLSTRDAARALAIKESTVRKQIERARADLRLAVGGGPGGPDPVPTPAGPGGP